MTERSHDFDWKPIIIAHTKRSHLGWKYKRCVIITHTHTHTHVDRIPAWSSSRASPGMGKAQYWALTQFGGRYLTGPWTAAENVISKCTCRVCWGASTVCWTRNEFKKNKNTLLRILTSVIEGHCYTSADKLVGFDFSTRNLLHVNTF